METLLADLITKELNTTCLVRMDKEEIAYLVTVLMFKKSALRKALLADGETDERIAICDRMIKNLKNYI